MIFILIIIHLIALAIRGFFLSPELSLYPYLLSQGFLPYKDIVDQHFPVIFFGPLSIPYSFVSNQHLFLIFFLIIIILTDILFYLSLKKHKSKSPLFYTSLFILIYLNFGGNTFWLETFIVFFLCLLFYLSKSKYDILTICTGIIFSLIFLIKPTLIIGLIILFFLLKLRPNIFFILGFMFPIIITLIFLIKHNISNEFIDLVFDFNRLYYLPQSIKYPTISQSIQIIFVTAPLLYFAIKKNILIIFAFILFGILIFPRFEFFHLLPSLVVLFFLTIASKGNILPRNLILLLLTLLIFNLQKTYRHHYGNFYFDQDTLMTADYLKKSSENTVLIIGGNDIIYQLAGKIPPSYTYIPSLPWYLSVEKYQQRLIQALKLSPTTPILINYNANIDNLAIVSKDTPLLKFIEENYLSTDKIGPYQVYQYRLFIDVLNIIR